MARHSIPASISSARGSGSDDGGPDYKGKRLGPQPPKVDPPRAPIAVTIRALRDHYGTRGMVLAGDTDDRSADDAAYLVVQGIATIVGPVTAAPNPQ